MPFPADALAEMKMNKFVFTGLSPYLPMSLGNATLNVTNEPNNKISLSSLVVSYLCNCFKNSGMVSETLHRATVVAALVLRAVFLLDPLPFAGVQTFCVLGCGVNRHYLRQS